ncbi:MAG: hypothetical protein PHO32_10340, partial [Candidatus Cloacimonetes bacterium]|nr:hypothetical protein [Candidatus Cloacimonadota bacterium]
MHKYLINSRNCTIANQRLSVKHYLGLCIMLTPKFFSAPRGKANFTLAYRELWGFILIVIPDLIR